jgi:predicted amidohydrolase
MTEESSFSMSAGKVTVAAVQLCSGSDAPANVATALDLVTKAADQGATYIQLPEYFNYYGPAANYATVAESIPGPTTDLLSEIAWTRKVVIHAGSMLEKSPDEQKWFNTSVVINDDGSIGATYRKAHLFDIEVPGKVSYRESRAIAAGAELVVAELARFNLGMSICFDLRFPELYRSLALRGATVLAIPSAFNAVTGNDHWDVLIKARAIENHAFVIAAAQAGTTKEGLSSYGHSIIVGPWGEVIAESTSKAEDVLVATLDLDEVARRRSQIAVLDLRRPDLYGLKADGD